MHTEPSDADGSEILTLELRPVNPPGNLGHLEKSLEAVPGVERVEIDRDEHLARVEHHGARQEELLRVLEVQGYDARLR